MSAMERKLLIALVHLKKKYRNKLIEQWKEDKKNNKEDFPTLSQLSKTENRTYVLNKLDSTTFQIQKIKLNKWETWKDISKCIKEDNLTEGYWA